MARTAPAPDLPPIPGMCPSVAVLAGGGDGGGGSGKGAGSGDGSEGAGTGAGGENAESDGKGAPDPAKYPDCGTVSHPVDVVTGRAFTHPILILHLPGPLPLHWTRAYSTAMAERDMGLGVGWGHTFGWEIEVGRRTITDSAGRVVRVVSGKMGRIASIEVQNAPFQGRWIASETYAHDSAANLISAVDADGFSSSYAYNEDHLLTADTDRAGLTFHFVYDLKRRCTESWGSWSGKKDPSLIGDPPKYLHDKATRWKGIHHCKLDYYQDNWTQVIDSTQARDFFGNRHGTLNKSVNGGGVTTSTYRDDGHLLTRMDAMGGTEHFDRNTRGNLIAYTDPLGRVTQIRRDANELSIEIIDPKGGVHRIERDPRGNPMLYTDPTGTVTTFRHDERGLLIEQVSPTGERTTYEYDAHGNRTKKTLPSGGVWRWTYDFLGRRRSEIDPLGAETRYVWSARGDLLAIHDAAGGVTQFTYDGEHHLTQIVAPNGAITTFTWGGFHKLCARRDANGHEVRFGYNVEGEMILVRNEKGEDHELEYNPAGRLIEEKTFDGRTLRYRLDQAGRVTRRTDSSGSKTSFTYDLTGQMIARELPGGGNETFSYDALGDLIGAEWSGGAVHFERDALGRVVREALTLGDEEYVVEVSRNPDGDRIRRATSLGHVQATERGLLGAPRRTVLDGEHIIEHEADVLGREIARTLPSGGWIESGFDTMGRLERRRVLGPAAARTVGVGEPVWVGPRADNVTVETAYRYDLAGELIASLDKPRGQTAYQYDPVGQLLARLPEKTRSEVFRYDPAGNLHESGAGAEPREYGPGNRLIRKGNTEYVWDRDGRLEVKSFFNAATGKKDAWRYRWNGAGLLQSVTAPRGEHYEYTYDPLGRRVEKRVGKPGSFGRRPVIEAVTRFVWDGDVLVHEIIRKAQAAGDPVEEVKTYCFEDEGFEPIAHRDAGGWFHYVNDQIGTPERLVDSSGRVACELLRDAWGRTEFAAGGKTKTPIRFQGQYEDEETGLCYNRYRYYDPEAASFVSSDPLGLQGGANAYKYAANPTTWVDPLGLIDRVMPDMSKLSLSATDDTALRETIDRIDGRLPPPAAGSLQSEKWGEEFHNYPRGTRKCGDLPARPKGYYKEYTPVAPGQTTRGTTRVIAGNSGELFYTNSHYEPGKQGSKPFTRIR